MSEIKVRELTDEELASVAGGAGDDMVEREIRGDYGNGQGREHNLRAVGFDYGDTQNQAQDKMGYNERHLPGQPK